MAMPLSVPRYTVQDVDQFPDDGCKHDLLDGVLLVTPGPSFRHEQIVDRLHGRLRLGLGISSAVAVLTRGQVQVGETTRLEPDLLVVPTTLEGDAPWSELREWWLAVEVLSRSNQRYDRDFKQPAYLAIGVAEVWLVDPALRAVEVWRQGAVAPIIVTDQLLWHPPAPHREVRIDLGAVFAGF